RRRAFNRDQRMWRPARVPRLVTLGEFDLVGFQTRFADHRSPRPAPVAAVKELLEDGFVPAAAVPSGQLGDDGEAVMLLALLPFRGLVAVEAADPPLCVAAHFVLVHDRVLLRRVALCALARRPGKLGGRLLLFDTRPRAVHEEGADDQREGN